MILDFLELENIRSYRQEKIEFPKNISLFRGDIGSGKSTILMAIEFALFGLTQNAESLLTKKMDHGSVTLGFSINDKKYQVHRELVKKSDKVTTKKCWIIDDDVEELLSITELKQRVLKILKFNEPDSPKSVSKIFRYAIYTPQEAMKDVLSDTDTRLETIRKAFNIEEYNIASSNATDLRRELEQRLGILEERFKDLSEWEEKKRKSEERIVDIQETITELEKTKNEYEKFETTKNIELEKLREENDEMNKIEVKIENLKNIMQEDEREVKRIEDRLASDKSSLEELDSRLEEITMIKKPDIVKTSKELDEEIAKFKKINNELVSYKAKKELAESEISKLKDLLGEDNDKVKLTTRSNELQEERKLLNDTRQKLTDDKKSFEKQKIENETERKKLEDEIMKLNKLGNKCLTCKQEIKEDYKQELVDDRKVKADNLIKDIKLADESIEKLDNKINDTDSKINTNESKINEIKEAISNVEKLESKTKTLQELESNIHALKQKETTKYGNDPVKSLTDAKVQLEKYENARNEIVRIDAQKKKFESQIQADQIAKKERQLSKSKKDEELSKLQDMFSTAIPNQIQQKEAELKSLRRNITQTASNLEYKNAEIVGEKSNVSEYEERIGKAKKWQEKHAMISECKDWVKLFLIPVIQLIEKQVLISIRHDFNEMYNRWYSILVEDPTKESTIDENFTPTVSQDGFDQNVEYLSGGEKTSIALAYRLTLNSLLRREIGLMDTSLLILDEPTDGFSKDQLSKMRHIFDELKSQQIILVSHERELESYVNNVFEVSKQGGISKVSN